MLEKKKIRAKSDVKIVPPRTSLEDEISKMWCEVLEIEQVSIHEDFFDLGGNSLLATQLQSRIHNIYKIDLAISDLFEFPTIAQLASCIDAMRDSVANENEHEREQGSL